MMALVRSLAEVQGLHPSHLNVPALNRSCRTIDAEETVMVFALETERPDASVHVRFFAPTYSIS